MHADGVSRHEKLGFNGLVGLRSLRQALRGCELVALLAIELGSLPDNEGLDLTGLSSTQSSGHLVTTQSLF